MDIAINNMTIKNVNEIISEIVQLISNISDSRHKVQTEMKELVMLDLLLRQYPNLQSISLLLNQYLNSGNNGNGLPIGLVMRCCLEDMIYAKYLLSFRENEEVFENEISVHGISVIKQNLEFQMNNMPEYWNVTEEEKSDIINENAQLYSQFKKENPEFFNSTGELKKIKHLREKIKGIEMYFNKSTLNDSGPFSMFKILKEADKEFSYAFFEYKFYCMFEHYSFNSRNVIQLDKTTFGHLCLSLEFVITGIVSILEYIGDIGSYRDNIQRTKILFKELLDNRNSE